MEITRTSLWSGVTRTRDLNITAEQLAQWQRGMLLQDAMPQLSVAEREFFMTGMTQEEWQDLTRNEDARAGLTERADLAEERERLEALELREDMERATLRALDQLHERLEAMEHARQDERAHGHERGY